MDAGWSLVRRGACSLVLPVHRRVIRPFPPWASTLAQGILLGPFLETLPLGPLRAGSRVLLSDVLFDPQGEPVIC